MVTQRISFKWFPGALLITYFPFHLIEEALYNFPGWMSEQYGLSKPLSYPHWLINNFIFLTVLLTGFIIFFRNQAKNIAFGIGILIWGFMNSCEHIVFSVIDQKFSPGIITAFLFLIISVSGMIKLIKDKAIHPKNIIKSVFIAISYWVVSFASIISAGKFLSQLFP